MEAPMAKIVAGELAEDFGEAALRILGPVAALSEGVHGVPAHGMFESFLRTSIMMVVGGGTGDIQRTLIARSLGMGR
jgi:alkylation response protein AidB-like acyl-CoA dehydrogenase